jgi:hypothetical protein
MKRKTNYLLYLILFTIVSKGVSQTDGVTAVVNRIISPSPTVAAIGKYEDVPVNECTGIPSISIPLDAVKVIDYSLPISLSYYAGGIRVEERAAWTGLGWSLNAGGVITRVVRGKPDESGYTGNDGLLIPANGNVSQYTHDGFMLLKNCATNVIDLQPDEYYFSFAGYSGKFVIAPDGTTHLMPASSIKIVRETYARKPRFVVTTDDGMIYIFAATETTEPSDNGEYGTPIGAYFSSWYLTSISFPDSKQTITFEYNDYTSVASKNYFYTERWQVIPPNGAGLVAANTNSSSIRTYGLHLSKINFPEGYVQFVPKNEARVDIPGDQILEFVKFYDNANVLVKNYKLGYTYYNNTASDGSLKRLRLETIQELGLSGGTIPPYTFNYNSDFLPSINSFDQDHWGFYNGAGNSKLIPAGKIGSQLIPGADREIFADKAKQGILEKITYPTGGTTVFEFEGNTQYADEKPLINAGQMATCNSGPNTNEPYSCSSETPPFTFANAVGDILVHSDRQLLQGNTANVYLRNLTTGGTIPLIYGPSYLLTGIDRTQTYKITTETYHEGGDMAEYVIGSISWKEYDNNSLIKSKPAPGLRIKKITTTDGVDVTATKVTSYEYDMFNDPGRSSGYITGAAPTYSYPFAVIPGGLPEVATNYVMRFSKSQADLGGSNCVFYKNVKKIMGTAAQNGSINSYYGIEGNDTYCAQNFFPFAPCTNQTYKNELLTRQVIISNMGKVVKDDSYTYYFDPTNNYSKVPGMAVGFSKRNFNDYGGTQNDFSSNAFDYTKYDYASEWFYLKNITSTLNDQNGLNPFITTTDYAYSNPAHMQLTSTSIKNSQGDQVSEGKVYPLDYNLTGTLTGTAAVIKEMVNQHILNAPIEEVNLKVITSPTLIIPFTSGTINTFKFSNNQIVKDATYSLKISTTTTGVPLSDPTNYISSKVTNGQFTYDSRYELRNSFDTYDSNNNLVQLTDRKGTHAMIREPNTGRAWAKSQQCGYADIAYSSFEHYTDPAFTNWSYNLAGITTSSAQTGAKAFNLSGNNINSLQPLSTSKKYKVSFWKKVDAATSVTLKAGTQTIALRTGPARNGWQYYEGTFTSATTAQVTGNAIIDELRLYPGNDRMISYVFKPVVGLMSVCDENNQTTFWEYDEFNRLKITRDQDKYILSKNEYNYQQVQ